MNDAGPEDPRRGPTVVTPDGVEDVVDILVEAFYNDPLWSWGFPDPVRRRDQHRQLWRMCVEGAARYPWVWLSEGRSATSVWIPPGGSEFSEQQEADLGPLLRDLLGSGATRVLEIFDLFNRTHPHDQPHYYLSLLATDPLQSGHGYGLALLSDNLRRVDEARAAAYLEASNSANVPLYARYGFEVQSSFRPTGGPEVITMWRPSRASR